MVTSDFGGGHGGAVVGGKRVELVTCVGATVTRGGGAWQRTVVHSSRPRFTSAER